MKTPFCRGWDSALGSRLVICVTLTLILAAGGLVLARDPKPSSGQSALYDEILAMDTAIFDAFNEGDANKIGALFTPDLEFFHDTAGLSDYDQNMAATRALFAQDTGLKRELVPGSMEVYPIKDYGAVQAGEHTFTHLENGEEVQGTFKFVHIWKREDEGWRISRVISYGH